MKYSVGSMDLTVHDIRFPSLLWDPILLLRVFSLSKMSGALPRISLDSARSGLLDLRPSLDTDVALRLFIGGEVSPCATGALLCPNDVIMLHQNVQDDPADTSSPGFEGAVLPSPSMMTRQLSSNASGVRELTKLSNIRIERATAESWVAASEYLKASW